MSEPTPATPLLPHSPSIQPSSRRAPPLLLIALGPVLLTLPLLLWLHVSPTSAARQSTSSLAPIPITLAALGDWGRYGKFGQAQVADALANTMRNVSARAAILSTGDNFYQTGVASLQDPQFNSSFEDVYSHLPLRSLPWYSILGNHDHLGSISAQTSYTLHSTRWRMPTPYYSHQLSPHLLAIFLDTTSFVRGDYGNIARQTNNQNPDHQLAWVKSVLEKARPDQRFIIVGHHNMYTMSTNDHLGTAEIRQTFEPVLAPYRKRILAYVSGHEHALMHMQPHPSNGYMVDHFLSGAGSKLSKIVEPEPEHREKWYKCCGVLPVSKKPGQPRTVWGKSVNGFFVFKFDGYVFEAEAVDHTGSVIYSYEKKILPI